MTIQIPTDLPSARIILYALRRSQRAYGQATHGFNLLRATADDVERQILEAELLPGKCGGAVTKGSGV
jgi:hypothetical protein